MSFNIKLNKLLEDCDRKDVISFGNQTLIDVGSLINRVVNILCSHEILLLQEKSNLPFNSNMFNGETTCEILKAGSQGWQKGKLQINVTLEFIPDEPESEASPLDDIRQAAVENEKV